NSHKITPSNDDSRGSVQPVVNPSENEDELMHIVYRIGGLSGDARKYTIERFYRKKNRYENGEDDPEYIYIVLANVLSKESRL
ncbi:unnamed protein product, partial [Rotaria sp. Silwood2]